MKRLILITLFTFIILNISNAQTCTPDTSIKNTGVYPSTLPNGVAMKPYSVVLQFKFPKDTVVFGTTIPIDSVYIESVSGFPDTSYNYHCNQNNCGYKGGQNGCATLTGNPTLKDTGTYLIKVTALVVIPNPLGPGYLREPDNATIKYRVNGMPSGINTISNDLGASQNFPNPFNSTTEISYTSDAPAHGTFSVYDLLGKPVYRQQLSAYEGLNSFIFNRGSLPSGMYFYNIALGNNVIARCMTITN